jgi:hypothetical protein
VVLIGPLWTPDQKRAYRSAFSIGRILDELWALFTVGFCVVFVLFLMPRLSGPLTVVAFLGGLGALFAITYECLPTLLLRTMPAELRAALPQSRFAGLSSPEAPRTYRELLQRWPRRPGGRGFGGRPTSG